MLQIVKYPHPVLRFASAPVRTIDAALRAQIREMFDLMYEHRGVGLAANQVGLPLRFFVLNVSGDPEQKDSERVFINPEITKRHSAVVGEEGCLSFPGLYGDVSRAKRIHVEAFDQDGREVSLDAEELLGRAIQHETDHLAGKLFIDYFSPAALKGASATLKELETAFRAAQERGEIAAVEEIERQLRAHTA